MQGIYLSASQIIKQWKDQAKRLKVKIYALYLAYQDPRTPWYAKAFTALLVGYAFSPIDLIPDFVPILGYVDDLILLPLGVMVAIKMIPSAVWEACEKNAHEQLRQNSPKNWIAAGIIMLIWLVGIALAIVAAQILINQYFPPVIN